MLRMQRVWIVRPGERRQKFVLVAPPWAKAGDAIHYKGQDWTVVKVQDERGFEVKFPSRRIAVRADGVQQEVGS